MRIILSIVALCVVGCQQSDRSTPGAQGAAASNAASPSRTWEDLVTLDTVESSLSDEQRPASPEELVAMFKQRYAESPERAFADLYYWGDLPQETRRQRLAGLLSFAHPLDGGETYRLLEDRSRLLSLEAYCRDIDMTPEEYYEGRPHRCTHVFDFTMSMASGATSASHLDVIQPDGVCYFYYHF